MPSTFISMTRVPLRRGKGDKSGRIARINSTSTTAVRNMRGNSPRFPQHHPPSDPPPPGRSLPLARAVRGKLMPSHQRLMRMLSLAVIPEERAEFRQRFCAGVAAIMATTRMLWV